MDTGKPKLLDQMKSVMRIKHYSLKTENLMFNRLHGRAATKLRPDIDVVSHSIINKTQLEMASTFTHSAVN